MTLKFLLSLGLALGLSACATVDAPSRNLALPGVLTGPEAAVQPIPGKLAIRQVSVTVPKTLTVSEANGYKPRADIVWREDPFGDRYAQVQAIVQNAADQAVRPFSSGHPVTMEIVMARFHALTEKTRYSFGGKHELEFYILLRDAKSGAQLGEPIFVQHIFEAYGGDKAIAAMRRGETQKVRITQHLIAEIQRVLSGLNAAPATAQG